MVRERHSSQRLAAQRNLSLPPSRQLEGGFCKLLKPDVETLRLLGRTEVGARPSCPSGNCAICETLTSCDKPMELEIGSGLGRFLLARAKNHPETHFFGIEQEEVRVARIDVAARMAGFVNLSLVCAEAMAMLEFCLPEKSMQAVYLFFPDPWPKTRHHKKRIFQMPLLDQIHRVLATGGLFHVATDHDDYFAWMEEVMAGEQRFEQVAPLVRTEDELTDFELKFMAKNKRTHAFSCRKIE